MTTTKILVQKDPKNLVPMDVTSAQRTTIAQNYTIYDLNADGTKSAPYGPTVVSGGTSMARTAAQLAGTPTAADIAIFNGLFTLDTDPTKRYKVNPAGTAYIVDGGGGGGSGTVTSVASKTPDVSGNVPLSATDVLAWGLPVSWSAASNTPTLTSGTAVVGQVFNNTSPGQTTLGTAIDGYTVFNQGDKLVCYASGSFTLVPANSILGPFANTTALQTAFPSATTPSAAFAWVDASAPYSLYYNSLNGWTSLTAGASSPTTSIDLYGGNSFLLSPLGTNTTTWSAVGASTSLAQIGTSTARTGQLASVGYISRIGIVGTTAAANTNAYGSSSSSLLQTVAPSTSSLFPTQRCRVVFCATDANSASRMGGGFISNTPTATVEPSTLTNNAWFAADSTDSQLSFMTCAGTGTATKTVLNSGTGFPANTNGADIYDAYIEFVGGTTRQINYCITNRSTGVKASGSVTANLPDAGTNLRVGAYRNSAANAATPSIDLISLAGGGFAQMGPTS